MNSIHSACNDMLIYPSTPLEVPLGAKLVGVGQLRVGPRLVLGSRIPADLLAGQALAARVAVAVCRRAADCVVEMEEVMSLVYRWLVVIAVVVTVVIVVPSGVVVTADDIVALPVARQW